MRSTLSLRLESQIDGAKAATILALLKRYEKQGFVESRKVRVAENVPEFTYYVFRKSKIPAEQQKDPAVLELAELCDDYGGAFGSPETPLAVVDGDKYPPHIIDIIGVHEAMESLVGHHYLPTFIEVKFAEKKGMLTEYLDWCRLHTPGKEKDILSIYRSAQAIDENSNSEAKTRLTVAIPEENKFRRFEDPKELQTSPLYREEYEDRIALARILNANFSDIRRKPNTQEWLIVDWHSAWPYEVRRRAYIQNTLVSAAILAKGGKPPQKSGKSNPKTKLPQKIGHLFSLLQQGDLNSAKAAAERLAQKRAQWKPHDQKRIENFIKAAALKGHQNFAAIAGLAEAYYGGAESYIRQAWTWMAEPEYRRGFSPSLEDELFVRFQRPGYTYDPLIQEEAVRLLGQTKELSKGQAAFIQSLITRGGFNRVSEERRAALWSAAVPSFRETDTPRHRIFNDLLEREKAWPESVNEEAWAMFTQEIPRFFDKLVPHAAKTAIPERLEKKFWPKYIAALVKNPEISGLLDKVPWPKDPKQHKRLWVAMMKWLRQKKGLHHVKAVRALANSGREVPKEFVSELWDILLQNDHLKRNQEREIISIAALGKWPETHREQILNFLEREARSGSSSQRVRYIDALYKNQDAWRGTKHEKGYLEVLKATQDRKWFEDRPLLNQRLREMLGDTR
ncbi:MAG: hypothetical protein AB1540_01265 [Bdellovibrionota bacterium]